MSNLPVALLVLGTGALLVRGGIANPTGGPLADAGRILRGEPSSKTRATTGAGFDNTAGGSGDWGAPSGAGAAVVAAARAQLGVVYTWGGNTPAQGFDCSGLTRWCWAKAGVTLPRLASAQQVTGAAVPGLAAAHPGDLLFYGTPAHHVAIYTGPGQQIDAPHRGSTVGVHPIYRDLVNIRRPG